MDEDEGDVPVGETGVDVNAPPREQTDSERRLADALRALADVTDEVRDLLRSIG